MIKRTKFLQYLYFAFYARVPAGLLYIYKIRISPEHELKK